MQFHVEDMMCGGCAKSVAKAIANLDDKARVEADPASRTLKVETSATQAAVEKALADAGFPTTARLEH
jgi:copper chaperone